MPHSDIREGPGTIVRVADGVVRIAGLPHCMAGERLQFANGVPGWAVTLEPDAVNAAVLGRFEDLKQGDPVACTGRLLHVPCGPGLLGRAIDPVGRPLDDLGPVAAEASWPLEHPGPAFGS